MITDDTHGRILNDDKFNNNINKNISSTRYYVNPFRPHHNNNKQTIPIVGNFESMKNRLNTHHFTSFQPPSTRALLQDFAFLFRIVAALQRSLLDRDGCCCCYRGGRQVQSAATGRHRSARLICGRDRDCCSHSTHNRNSYSGHTRTDTAVRRRHHRRAIDKCSSVADVRRTGSNTTTVYYCGRLFPRPQRPGGNWDFPRDLPRL